MTLSPLVIYSSAALVIIFCLLAYLGLLLAERRTRANRLRTAVGGRSSGEFESTPLRGDQNLAWQKSAMSFMRASTQKLSVIKDRQAHATRLLLISAGYRNRDAVVVYAFFKLVAPLVFLSGAALYIYGLDPIGKGPMFDIAAIIAAALLGSKLPDIILRNKQSKRMDAIRKALPDSLDMLVICAEAGLASDASLKRVVIETGRKSSVLSEELNQTVMELSLMPERRIALENLAERVPLPSVNAFVNTLIQAEKYGTPLARAFKVLSQEQRTERMLKAEEKAGRLPATMTVPMMIFILPALFIVLIGPAILNILDNFIGMK